MKLISLIFSLFLCLSCYKNEEVSSKDSNFEPFAPYWFPRDIKNWRKSSDKHFDFNKSVNREIKSRELAEHSLYNTARDNVKVVALSIMNKHTSNNPSQDRATRELYTFLYWQYIDILVMWGGSSYEGIILAPSSDVIDVAHKNGVLALGTIFFPPNVYGGKAEWVRELLEKKSNGVFPLADKLIEIADSYGFDGWFFNQETAGLMREDANNMIDFLKYLNKIKKEHMHIMWYDSMLLDGSILWQDELNDNNKHFLGDEKQRVSDSIFLNFNFTREMLENSIEVAKKLNRSPYDIFAGVDVQEYGTAMLRDKLKIIFEEDKLNTSLGLYAPDWTYSKVDDPLLFLKREREFWDLIAREVKEKTVLNELPFVTDFNVGQGKYFFESGEKVSKSEWANRSLQSILPTYMFKDINGISYEWDFEDAFWGGSSLKINGILNKGEIIFIPLYALNMTLDEKQYISLLYKTKSDINVYLGSKLFNENKINDGFKINEQNSWKDLVVSLKKRVLFKDLGVYIESKNTNEKINFNLNLGGISVFPKHEKFEAKVSNLKESERDGKALKLEWTLDRANFKNPLYYIYKYNNKGEREWQGATYNTNYYIRDNSNVNKWSLVPTFLGRVAGEEIMI